MLYARFPDVISSWLSSVFWVAVHPDVQTGSGRVAMRAGAWFRLIHQTQAGVQYALNLYTRSPVWSVSRQVSRSYMASPVITQRRHIQHLLIDDALIAFVRGALRSATEIKRVPTLLHRCADASFLPPYIMPTSFLIFSNDSVWLPALRLYGKQAIEALQSRTGCLWQLKNLGGWTCYWLLLQLAPTFSDF